jgi:hypothetical protein
MQDEPGGRACFQYKLSASDSNLCSGLPAAGERARHDHIRIDAEMEADPDALQRGLERLPAYVRRQQGTAMIATERDEVALSGLVKSFQTPRHGAQLTLGSFTHSSQKTA